MLPSVEMDPPKFLVNVSRASAEVSGLDPFFGLLLILVEFFFQISSQSFCVSTEDI
jgi:hypothetical protein